MFSMNKYIGAHVEPYKPIDLSHDGGGAESKKRKAKASPNDTDEGAKKQTQVPYRLSDSLVAVVGKSVLPRPQVTQALWVYIRENNLQVGWKCMLLLV
jgi:upstream activation factor subunit UAF30